MLTFDPKDHVYSLDGKILPSVTQALNVVPASFFCSGTVLAEAQERGTHVHAATAYDDERALDEASVRPEIMLYCMAWRKFRAQTGFVPVVIEKIGANRKYGYAGTLDRIGTVGNRTWLVDIKTGVPDLRTCLQTAAYAELDEIKAAFPKLDRYAVELRDDGTFRMSEQYKSAQDFAVFLAFLKVYNFAKAND